MSAADLEYSHLLWGECIRGSKEMLQRLGIAVGMAFPGEAGAPKRCVKTVDPRGFPTQIEKSYSGSGYQAYISLPGRESPSEAPPQHAAPGVMVREFSHSDIYTGTAEALVAAGLMQPGQFPGQPGMRKATVTIYADGTFPIGAPTKFDRRADEAGAKRVKRATKNTFDVFVRVAEHVMEQRCAAYRTMREEYEVRMRALPRPARLSNCGSLGRLALPSSVPSAGNVVNLQARRLAREKAVAASRIKHRIPPNNSEQRLLDRKGNECRLLWVSAEEANLLSDILEFGVEAAVRRLMQKAGKPWPAPAAEVLGMAERSAP